MKWSVTAQQMLSEAKIEELLATVMSEVDLNSSCRGLNPLKDYFILVVALESGLRISELASLKVCDFIDGKLVVRHGKGGKARTVLLSRQAQQLLREFIRVKAVIFNESVVPDSPMFISERGGAFGVRALRYRIMRWFTLIGVSGLSPHALRHTNATMLLKRGVDLATLRENLGHSNISVTSTYLHLTRDELPCSVVNFAENTTIRQRFLSAELENVSSKDDNSSSVTDFSQGKRPA